MAKSKPDRSQSGKAPKKANKATAPKRAPTSFYKALRASTHRYTAVDLAAMLKLIDQERYRALSDLLANYIGPNLQSTIGKKGGIANYRINPYVLMASAGAMSLTDPGKLADFIFNSKLYAGLETSFGKSLERLFLTQYPIGTDLSGRWADPPEKLAEAETLKGLEREEKARRRVNSVWREIDRACVFQGRRYLVSIKSGPNCINDTQVQGMTDAIALRHEEWFHVSQKSNADVKGLDVVIGITYGTDKTTNNKENQILAKLLGSGFREEDRKAMPGVLVNKADTVRVYRRVGRDFWSFVGNPTDPASASFVFVETLLAIAKGLSKGLQAAKLQDQINLKLAQLSAAFAKMILPHHDLPDWARGELTADELFWLTTALTAFFDEGI